MDQVKKILAVLKEHHFWIINGIAVLAVMGAWFVVTSDLRKQELDKKSDIEAKFNLASTVRGKQNHPNDSTHAQMDVLYGKRQQDVAAAWTAQYEYQRDILVYPEDLGPKCIAQFDRFRPIEVVPYPTGEGNEVLVEYREQYRDYIKEELPKLAEMIGANWQATDTGGSSSDSMGTSTGPGMGIGTGYSGMPDPGSALTMAGQDRKAKTYVVNWATEDQTRLQNARFDWRNQVKKAPSTLQVLYAQEDLWVMQEIMRIIRKTNGDVKERYNAAIKKIDFIRLGSDAVGQAGQVTRAASAAAASAGMGTGMGMSMGMGPAMGMGAGSGAGGMTGSGSSGAAMGGTAGPGGSVGGTLSANPDPGDNRYVDNDFKPLLASKLREALSSKKPDDAFLVVAKRVPVRIRLTMDQRKLNRLLAEFGNANLPVEIRQVRLNREAASMGGSGGAGGYGMGGSMGMSASMGMGSMGSAMGMGTGGGASGDGSGSTDTTGMGSMGAGMGMMGANMGTPGGIKLSDDSPFDLPIELLGIVYIYNPADMAKLGIQVAAQGQGTPTNSGG